MKYIKKPGILVVDNFYPDLDWLQPYLDSHMGIKRENVNYGGLVYPPPVEQTSFALNKISSLINHDVTQDTNKEGDIRLSYGSHEKEYKSFVHVDPSFNVVIYLSGNQTEAGGTVFYRHKEFGVDTLDQDAKDSTSQKLNLLLHFDTHDLSKWDIVQKIPFKNNRAVLFNGSYFHSIPVEFYGSDTRTGRVSQSFFFTSLKELFLTN